MKGCEIVCPPAIGSAASSYARSRRPSGTKSSRGTRAIAARTRSSVRSRARSCCSTMRRRSSCRSGGTRERPRIRRRRDSEMTEHGGRDVNDRPWFGVEADREHRDLRVAPAQRAVTATAGVVAAREIRELDSGCCRNENVARVRVVQRGPGTEAALRIVEQRRVAVDAYLVAVTTRKDLVALTEEQ